jgi:hypothetical protein
MKRRVIHAILALCAVVLVTVPLAAQQWSAAAAEEESTAGGPKAVIEEPVFDAGKVPTGDKITHDFVIRNEGDAPLTLTDVRPACGCTVAEYDEVIPAGGSGKVHTVLDTTTFGGAISKHVTVLTDDAANPRVILTVKAVVEHMIFVRPGFARFIQPQLSDPGVVEQILFTPSFDELKILGVESPYPFMKVDYREATEDERQEEGKGKQWVVTVTIDYDTAPVGAIADYVHIQTNHPQQDEVTIPVSGFVRPMVVLTPNEANFGSVDLAEDETEATMLLKNYAPQGIQVSVEETTVPGVDVAVEEVKEGREFRVVLTLGDELPKGEFDGLIRLKLDHPKMKTLEIPLHGTRL